MNNQKNFPKVSELKDVMKLYQEELENLLNNGYKITDLLEDKGLVTENIRYIKRIALEKENTKVILVIRENFFFGFYREWFEWRIGIIEDGFFISHRQAILRKRVKNKKGKEESIFILRPTQELYKKIKERSDLKSSMLPRIFNPIIIYRAEKTINNKNVIVIKEVYEFLGDTIMNYRIIDEFDLQTIKEKSYKIQGEYKPVTITE